MEHKEILATMLRRAFLPFDQTLLVKTTPGLQAQANNRKLQEWLSQHHAKKLVIDAACIFDGLGIHGVLDKVNVAVGMRGAVANNAIPWVLLTRSHICVAVWPLGKIQVSPGKASFTGCGNHNDLRTQWPLGEGRRLQDKSLTE